MGAEASAQRVLVVGLDPHRIPGPWDPEPVAAAIAAGERGLADAGVDAVSCLVGLDGRREDVAAHVAATVTAALRSGHWDCVLVGGGLRDPELLDVFETVLNLVHRHAPQAAIALNRGLDDLVDAVLRQLRPGR